MPLSMRRLLHETSSSAANAAVVPPNINELSENNTRVATAIYTTTNESDPHRYTTEQLTTLCVSGWLSLVLYTALSMVILWMTYVHFKHGSSLRKKIFHIVLFTSILLNIPDPVGWIFWPESERWEVTYPMRIYAVLLQSTCKYYIAICWSEVVSAGQSYETRRLTRAVLVLLGLLVLWAISVPFVVTQYPDNVFGEYDFSRSFVRDAMTYAVIVVVLLCGALLTYQGMRLRRRLLLAKGMVPAGSVEKSLSQLLLTVCVVVFSDLLRVSSQLLSESGVAIQFTTFVVINNLIPTIFPTICMLYLMRRITRPRQKNHFTSHSVAVDDAVVDDDGPDIATLSGQNSRRYLPNNNAHASKFALPNARISVAKLELPHDQRSLNSSSSSGGQRELSPAFCWVRES